MNQANLFSGQGLAPIQRGNTVGSAVPLVRNFSRASSTDSLNMWDRSVLTPANTMGTSLGRSSRQSLIGSTDSLNKAHPQFARALQGTQPPLISMSDDMQLRQRVPPRAASVNAGGFDGDFS